MSAAPRPDLVPVLGRLLGTGMLLFALAGPALAHDVWLQASSYQPEPGSLVEVALREGHGVADPRVVVRDSRRIERFVAVSGSDEQPVLGVDGHDPAGVLQLPQGLAVVAYRGKPLRHTLGGAKFQSYLLEEGLDEVHELRLRRGQAGLAAHESYSRSLKCLLAVGGAGAAAEGGDRPLGLTLELVAEDNPYGLRPGDLFHLRVEHRGEPVAQALVVAEALGGSEVPGGTEGPFEGRTDAAGRVAFALPHPGPWVLTTVYMEAARPGSGVEWESIWAAMTFELSAPSP